MAHTRTRHFTSLRRSNGVGLCGLLFAMAGCANSTVGEVGSLCDNTADCVQVSSVMPADTARVSAGPQRIPFDGEDVDAGLSDAAASAMDRMDAVSAAPAARWRFDPSLAHRYTFDGEGERVTDSIGDSHGMVRGKKLDGSGDLVLAGGDTNQYVDLPNGLTRVLSSITIEAWFTPTGNGVNEALFDFGNNDAGEDNNTGTPTSYLCLRVRNARGRSEARINFTYSSDESEDIVATGPPVQNNVMHQVAVVFDGHADELRVHVDGRLASLVSGVAGMLAQIDDRNVWIGRSNQGADTLRATLHDFRIYSEALDRTAIETSFEQGPSPRVR